jgi:alcohol dehydrogenase class IV
VSLLDDLETAREDFVWKDGERLIAFGPSALASLPAYLRAQKMEQHVLLTTERSLGEMPELEADAEKIVLVGPGRVDELAAVHLDAVGGLPIVALGGGRVIDTAKSIAGTGEQRVAAIPTTLSGAPMTGSHRPAAHYEGPTRRVRPAIVIAIPDQMASQPRDLLTGSAMNALSHAIESAFVTTTSPVPRMAALRAIELLSRTLVAPPVDAFEERRRLALGAIEAGYAVGASGFALHHALCQTIVRIAEVSHAPTYGVMLPYTLEFMKVRDDLTWTLVSEAMGTPDPSLTIAKMCADAGNPTTLTALGVAPERVELIIAEASSRPELRLTPGGANTEDIKALLESAM